MSLVHHYLRKRKIKFRFYGKRLLNLSHNLNHQLQENMTTKLNIQKNLLGVLRLKWFFINCIKNSWERKPQKGIKILISKRLSLCMKVIHYQDFQPLTSSIICSNHNLIYLKVQALTA